MRYSNISLVYIMNHFIRRIGDFFRHWYIDGFLKATDLILNGLERLDRRFALRITAKNWFQPLYQDYSAIGYLWGFIFRTIRIAVSLFVYGVFLSIAAILFLIWLLIPFFVIYEIFKNV